MIEIKSYVVLFLFLIVISIYYALTIPSNSIWLDQTTAVNLAKDILNGHFPLVGYPHSNRIHSSCNATSLNRAPLPHKIGLQQITHWSIQYIYVIVQ